MEIRQLKIFLKVCETMNFTKAAKELSYAQSTISDSIKMLEQSLDVKLFDRIGKKVYLTSKGQELKISGNKVMEQYELLMNQMIKGNERIRIGITETLCSYKFPDFFRAFLEKERHVEFQFKILRCEDIADCLRKNEIDIAYTLDEAANPDDLNSFLLSNEEIVFVSSNKVDNIENRNLIIPEGETGYLRMLWVYIREEDITTGMVTNIESIEGIKNYVKSGFGISFIPLTTVQKEIENGQLHQVDLSQSFYHEIKIWLHKNKVVSSNLKKLIDETLKQYPLNEI